MVLQNHKGPQTCITAKHQRVGSLLGLEIMGFGDQLKVVCNCKVAPGSPHGPPPAPEVSRGFAHEPVGSALIKPPQLQCGNTQTTIVYTRTFSTSYNFFWTWTGLTYPSGGIFPVPNIFDTVRFQYLIFPRLLFRYQRCRVLRKA